MHDMMEKLHNEALPYIWVVLLSAWGGLAGYVRKIKQGEARLSLSEIVGEICVSAFVGVITYLLCMSANINLVLTGAIVGISGHMGSRAIFLIEKIITDKVEHFLNSDKP